MREASKGEELSIMLKYQHEQYSGLDGLYKLKMAAAATVIQSHVLAVGIRPPQPLQLHDALKGKL